MNRLDRITEGIELRPEKFDKHGAAFSKDKIINLCAKLIKSEVYFEERAKAMTTDAEKAIQKTGQVTAGIEVALDKLYAVEKKFVDNSKHAAGSVKDASERISQGIVRIEKAANFDRLSQYVVLLERAATAMQILADLEKTGKLEKIASAIR